MKIHPFINSFQFMWRIDSKSMPEKSPCTGWLTQKKLKMYYWKMFKCPPHQTVMVVLLTHTWGTCDQWFHHQEETHHQKHEAAQPPGQQLVGYCELISAASCLWRSARRFHHTNRKKQSIWWELFSAADGSMFGAVRSVSAAGRSVFMVMKERQCGSSMCFSLWTVKK